jgi:hypothetical protein
MILCIRLVRNGTHLGIVACEGIETVKVVPLGVEAYIPLLYQLMYLPHIKLPTALWQP